MADRLRVLWDFADLEASRRRFCRQLEREETDAGRAEVVTQLARIEGLRGDFETGARLLDEAEPLAGADPAANVRLELERGRMFRSSGDAEAAFRLFKAAFGRAIAAEEHYLAGDAAHMAALAGSERTLEWTQPGLELAESEPAAAYWAGPLLNNLGWRRYDVGDHEAALDAFERGLVAREREPEKEHEIQMARLTVAVALRALGRSAEAATHLEQAIAWSERTGKADARFHEELAEDYAALGRAGDAARQAERALALVDVEAEPSRAARLRDLAAGG